MKKKILYVRLMRWWPPEAPRDEQRDLYAEIKAGTKTSEFRDVTQYWYDRLYKLGKNGIYRPKVNSVWFTVGFPKGNLPRLEADITNIIVHKDDPNDPYQGTQYEIEFENVVEVLE